MPHSLLFWLEFLVIKKSQSRTITTYLICSYENMSERSEEGGGRNESLEKKGWKR